MTSRGRLLPFAAKPPPPAPNADRRLRQPRCGGGPTPPPPSIPHSLPPPSPFLTNTDPSCLGRRPPLPPPAPAGIGVSPLTGKPLGGVAPPPFPPLPPTADTSETLDLGRARPRQTSSALCSATATLFPRPGLVPASPSAPADPLLRAAADGGSAPPPSPRGPTEALIWVRLTGSTVPPPPFVGSSPRFLPRAPLPDTSQRGCLAVPLARRHRGSGRSGPSFRRSVGRLSRPESLLPARPHFAWRRHDSSYCGPLC